MEQSDFTQEVVESYYGQIDPSTPVNVAGEAVEVFEELMEGSFMHYSKEMVYPVAKAIAEKTNNLMKQFAKRQENHEEK